MVNSDTKHRLDEDDRSSLMPALSTPLNYPASLSQNGAQAAAAIEPGVANVGAYTLMVAGQRTGKTSFLRLLLDTSDISPSTTKDQLASVAKFVQGCSGHTSNIRTASIDVELDTLGNGVLQRLGLTLVDTPSLDFQDEASAERLVLEILRHVDSRLAEGIEDVSSRPRLHPLKTLNSSIYRSGRPAAGITTSICAWAAIWITPRR